MQNMLYLGTCFKGIYALGTKKEHLANQNKSCTMLASVEEKKARGMSTASLPAALPVYRILTIRSTTHERRASSRRRIIHGQIEGP